MNGFTVFNVVVVFSVVLGIVWGYSESKLPSCYTTPENVLDLTGSWRSESSDLEDEFVPGHNGNPIWCFRSRETKRYPDGWQYKRGPWKCVPLTPCE